MKTRAVFILALFLGALNSIAGYDPSIGRWLSRDPIGEEDGPNLYGYVLNDPINWFDPFGLQTVTVNGATANLPGGSTMSAAGFQHQWITTDKGASAGMGNQRGVPGENGQTSPDMPGASTQVVDHTGRVPANQQNIPGVDMDALASYMKPGTPTGPWIPGVNDCNTYVKNAIQKSTPHRGGRGRGSPTVVEYADGTKRKPGPNISK